MEDFIFVVVVFAVVFGLVYSVDSARDRGCDNDEFTVTYSVYASDDRFYGTAVIEDLPRSENNKYGKLLMLGYHYGTARRCETSIRLNHPDSHMVDRVDINGALYDLNKEGDVAKGLLLNQDKFRLEMLKQMNKRC